MYQGRIPEKQSWFHTQQINKTLCCTDNYGIVQKQHSTKDGSNVL